MTWQWSQLQGELLPGVSLVGTRTFNRADPKVASFKSSDCGRIDPGKGGLGEASE